MDPSDPLREDKQVVERAEASYKANPADYLEKAVSANWNNFRKRIEWLEDRMKDAISELLQLRESISLSDQRYSETQRAIKDLRNGLEELGDRIPKKT